MIDKNKNGWYSVNGIKIHYINGNPENEDGLTIVGTDGDMYWHKNSKLHRDNDLPAVVHINGEMRWYKNGVPHRDNNLPAYIGSDGSRVWLVDGKHHRLDGPAIERCDGTYDWYINDVHFSTKDEYEKAVINEEARKIKQNEDKELENICKILKTIYPNNVKSEQYKDFLSIVNIIKSKDKIVTQENLKDDAYCYKTVFEKSGLTCYRNKNGQYHRLDGPAEIHGSYRKDW